MSRYVVGRLLAVVPVLFGVSVTVFVITQLAPGDVASAILGPQATPVELEALRSALGLDKPIYVQYGRWLGRVLRGDFGRSIVMGDSVTRLLWGGFTKTLLLASAALAVAVAIGIVAGVVSAIYQYSVFDRLSTILALLGNSMPPFWLGILLILLFSVQLRWLPTGGMYSLRGAGGPLDLLAHLVLPAVTLSAASMAYIMRVTRSSMLEVIRQDYVQSARAKGLPRRMVVFKHALRNALLPVVTVIGLRFGYLLCGSVITETVFSWPGIGLLMYNAISSRDYPIVQGGVILIAASFVVVNLAVDLLYSVLDPRIRYN